LANLKQIQDFIQAYAGVSNDVESLERVMTALDSETRATAELVLYRYRENSPAFKYPVQMNVAKSYLNGRLTAKKTELAEMDAKLLEISVE